MDAKEKEWVLITGGSRGIGRALVKHLANQYNVVFTWRDSQQQATELQQECAEMVGSVIGYCCDGVDEVQVAEVAARLLTEYGAPHGIIHNAGIARDALHIHQSSQEWLSVIDNNLNAVFNWNRHVLPAMMVRGCGSIIMMSSVSAVKGNIGQVAYSATKAAMVGMTRSLACEVARFNIRVNSLLPGLIETDMSQKMSYAERKALRAHIPLRRLGQVEEVAQAAAFLLGDSSTYMTGQSLVLDGGLSA